MGVERVSPTVAVEKFKFHKKNSYMGGEIRNIRYTVQAKELLKRLSVSRLHGRIQP